MGRMAPAFGYEDLLTCHRDPLVLSDHGMCRLQALYPSPENSFWDDALKAADSNLTGAPVEIGVGMWPARDSQDVAI